MSSQCVTAREDTICFNVARELSPIFYKCPACGATSQRGIPLRGKALKCHRCGMLMLEVV